MFYSNKITSFLYQLVPIAAVMHGSHPNWKLHRKNLQTTFNYSMLAKTCCASVQACFELVTVSFWRSSAFWVIQNCFPRRALINIAKCDCLHEKQCRLWQRLAQRGTVRLDEMIMNTICACVMKVNNLNILFVYDMVKSISWKPLETEAKAKNFSAAFELLLRSWFIFMVDVNK